MAAGQCRGLFLVRGEMISCRRWQKWLWRGQLGSSARGHLGVTFQSGWNTVFKNFDRWAKDGTWTKVTRCGRRRAHRNGNVKLRPQGFTPPPRPATGTRGSSITRTSAGPSPRGSNGGVRSSPEPFDNIGGGSPAGLRRHHDFVGPRNTARGEPVGTQ